MARPATSESGSSSIGAPGSPYGWARRAGGGGPLVLAKTVVGGVTVAAAARA
ncbi:hypothetical protein [Nocardia farcinica]|uniref:hypothetical protein n=1 Tax=Nocardia farcinica TaxID=37329 RepID=UPI00245386E4|nr:hypothetical protein [Nocardia farcinica]